MRFINFMRVQARITEKWRLEAEAALHAVEGLPCEERKKAIKAKSKIWRDLSDILGDASFGKCWYCESREDRSHNPVDHFRPKSAVNECKEHEGYWWLAFDWSNYRFCCTYCNSALKDEEDDEDVHGKQDHFPLMDPALRAMKKDDDLGRESPTLLDPIRSSDTKLLFFDMWGKANEKYLEAEDREKYLRTFYSINIFNLNHSKIKRARMAIYNRVKELIDESYRKRQLLEECVDLPPEVISELRRSIDQIDQTLAQMMSEDAEFSSAARCYAMSLRGPRGKWLDDLLQAV